AERRPRHAEADVAGAIGFATLVAEGRAQQPRIAEPRPAPQNPGATGLGHPRRAVDRSALVAAAGMIAIEGPFLPIAARISHPSLPVAAAVMIAIDGPFLHIAVQIVEPEAIGEKGSHGGGVGVAV